MQSIELDGKWKCKADKGNVGIEEEWFKPKNYDPLENDLLDIHIPNSFNLLEGYDIYEGIFWHFHEFNLTYSEDKTSFNNFINFQGANYITQAWLNGVYLGEFHGGFTPFRFKITQQLKKKNNLLVVRTDNTRRKGQVPDYCFDWFNWGGIYRSVELLRLHKNRITDIVIKTTVKSLQESIIEIKYNIIGNLSFRWQILDTDHKSVLFEGDVLQKNRKGELSQIIKKPELWSPDNPNLYYLKVISKNPESSGEILYETHFGIRQIEIKGKYVYLNKKRIYFKGISLHEEYHPYGRTIPYEKREKDIKNMKSLGLNALRTAHYSHDEALNEIADNLGILILEEIPVYWFGDYKSNETFKVAAKQMRNLIKRDINHPSVVWWSVGNEVPIEMRECSRFFKRMMDWVRRFDDTRIVTFVSSRMFCDLTKRYADVGAINMYWGWYKGSVKMINTIVDIVHTPIFDKPLFYTEFGAGAKYGFHADQTRQKKFSEEKQLQVLDYTIRTLNSKDYIAGWFIWIYRDFRSLIKQEKYQKGFNRKGIVSEKNQKKLMYYRLPHIINKKRKLISSRLISSLLWCIFFPFAYLLTYLGDVVGASGHIKRINKGKETERERLQKQGKKVVDEN